TTRARICCHLRRGPTVRRRPYFSADGSRRVRGSDGDGLTLDVHDLLVAHLVDPAQRARVGEPVGEEDAVQVVDLVLDGTGQQAGALDPHRLAVAVERLAHHLVGTRHLPHHAGDGEAALVADLLPVRLDDLGV